MNKANIIKYKAILEARKSEIEEQLVEIEDRLEEPADPDFSDNAIEHEDDEVLEAQGLKGQKEILAISAALQRIENDEFGICVSCGEAISNERLDIIPYAIKCRNCMNK